MIIDRELDQKGKDENIGTSRVNLTQRYVESVKYNGLGDFTEELREEADYRKRIEKIFSEIHMTGETYADLQPEALMEAYWPGRGNDIALLLGKEAGHGRHYLGACGREDCTAAGYGRFVCLLQ